METPTTFLIHHRSKIHSPTLLHQSNGKVSVCQYSGTCELVSLVDSVCFKSPTMSTTEDSKTEVPAAAAAAGGTEEGGGEEEGAGAGIEQELEVEKKDDEQETAAAAAAAAAAVVEVKEGAADDNNDGDGGDNDDKTKKVHMKVAADAPWSERMWEVFSTFWPLGLVAFGGPQVRFSDYVY